ncbi:MAG: hypothetical protein QG670_2649 [Thermoproteota archaeon]|nr:hypothetical protein [Thermoproteota archaeon]
MIINSEEAEKDALLNVAKLMVAAARTAPKAGGRDNIKTMILTGEDKNRLADAMSTGRSGETNPRNVRDAGAVVLIGIDFEENREEWFGMRAKLIDLGIALGSAVKVASDLNIDNRIFYSAGRAANESGIMKADEVQGIPIAIKGKNIFFDRTPR